MGGGGEISYNFNNHFEVSKPSSYLHNGRHKYIDQGRQSDMQVVMYPGSLE